MSDNYVIIGGATADLPKEVAEEYELDIIPMTLQIGEKDFVFHPDERDLTIKEFYTRLRAGENPYTSQINPQTFKEYFTRYMEEGKDILYLSFSSGLSGTYNSSRLVAEDLMEKYPGRKIICIDSLCASIGEGLYLFLAGRLKKQGKSLEEVAEWAKENCTKICHWFSVDDLYHLKRGGRLSGFEALVGTALKIKPILSVDSEGKLTVVSKVRGTKKAMDYIRQRLIDDGINAKEQTVMIGHADVPEIAEQLKEQLLSEGLVKEVIITNIGPVIGTHVGAGMFALTFLGENYKF